MKISGWQSILLKNCKLLIENKAHIKDILIEDNRISKIDNNISYDGRIIDIKKKFVIPGLIDPHVHFRDPGLTQKEDFFTGSCAAAAGGVTTFLDMPNTIPPMITVELLKKKRKSAKKSIVNYGFHFGGAQNNADEIRNAKNIASTKVFLNISTGKLMINDEESLKNIFKASKLITVHAEDEQVKRAINIAKITDTKLYLCHISQKSELDMIKYSGYENLFVEATPHHLFLTEDDKSEFNIMKPELRTKEDHDALWKAIDEGLIDAIGTDHAPHLADEKKAQTTYGVPGIETMLPLLLDACNKGKITLGKIHALCCENPAKIFGIKNKSHIKEGYDADLTVVDLNLEKKVEGKNQFTKCKWSPYEGKVLKGWPVMTICNGNIVFDSGKIFDSVKGKEVEFE